MGQIIIMFPFVSPAFLDHTTRLLDIGLGVDAKFSALFVVLTHIGVGLGLVSYFVLKSSHLLKGQLFF